MLHVPSEKKTRSVPGYRAENKLVNLEAHIAEYYKDYFTVHRTNSSYIAYSYLLGLMKCEKNHTNIERMAEDVPEVAYHQYHHFLTNSIWDAKKVNKKTALLASDLFARHKIISELLTGLILDESSHLKKGIESVGVARQYAGVSGKVDNCQVAVYSSLCNGDNTTIIGAQIFLPKQWTDDKERCKKAGIPKKKRKFLTKPQIALKLIKSAIKQGVQFDWIGGDGLYGHNSELTAALDDLEQFYVLDVHKDEYVYLEKPNIEIPSNIGKTGAPYVKARADKPTTALNEYMQSLEKDKWTRVKIRKTAKGWKYVLAHKVQVWYWNGKEETARCRTVIITKTEDIKPKIKYSFSNGAIDEHTLEEYAYFQCNRYWVERSFDDAKNELGLSGYQVRKWRAWEHHQSLVMMAGLYLLRVKMENKENIQLMSIRDARIMIIANLFSDQATIEKLEEQMIKRHEKRQKDIDRYYKEPPNIKV